MKNPKAGKARSRLKTHMKSQMRRSQSRQIDRLIDKLDRDETIKHHHNRQVVDRVKQHELVKEYGPKSIITPLRHVPAGAIKKESGIVKILIDTPPNAEGKCGKARITIGFKVVMMDGSSWLYHFRFRTWTRHSSNGSKESYGSWRKVVAEMGHCKPLIDVLSTELKAYEVD